MLCGSHGGVYGLERELSVSGASVHVAGVSNNPWYVLRTRHAYAGVGDEQESKPGVSVCVTT